jgi:chromosomal replication initiation ATPase DnaA
MRDLVFLKPTMRQIADAHAAAYGVTLDDLKGPRRDAFMANIRWDAMLEIRRRTKHSLPQIGRFFNRDHTSVLYAIRRASGETAESAKTARVADRAVA